MWSEVKMTETTLKLKKTRSLAQVAAEARHDQHRIHFKISANLKTNPDFARKFQRYKEAGLLGKLLNEAITNAPDNPEDYIPVQQRNKA